MPSPEGQGGRPSPAEVLDDLPGPVKLVSVVGFFATLAAITQLPRLWGYEALWQNIRLVGPVWSLAWFGSTLVLGNRWVAARPAERQTPIAQRSAVRRARIRVAWLCIRAFLGAALLALMAFAMIVGPQASAEDQRLIDTAPRHTATIVEVYQDPLSRHGPTITVELDGRRVELWLEYPGDNDAEVGDTLEVVVDPEDPETVIATTAHDDWVYSRIGTIALNVGLGALALIIAVPMMLVPRPRELRAAWRGGTAQIGTATDTPRTGRRGRHST